MKLIIIVFVFLLSLQVFAFNVKTNMVGNVYYPKDNIQVTVDTDSSITYKLTNYYGKIIKEGVFNSSINFLLSDPCWYKLNLTDGKENKDILISVIPNKLKTNNKSICGDAAASWLVGAENMESFAKIIGKTDIGGVRERIDWSSFQKSPKEFNTSRYDYVFDAYKRYNIDVYEVNHDNPEWTRTTSENNGVEDLRNVYNFHKKLASTYKEVSAWEVWNEPELIIWNDNSSRMAGYAKAAYLGVKAGNKNALCVGVSMCAGAVAFNKNLVDCGYLDYTDKFNWHTYVDPSEYPEVIKSYINMTKDLGYGFKSSWITEAGNRDFSMSAVEFIPTSAVMSMACGNERNYYFVVPPYLEVGINYGLMRPDFNLLSGFTALATTAHFLGDAEYLGRYKNKNSNTECRVFKDKNSVFAVVWGNGDVELPVEKDAKLYDVFGKRINTDNDNKTINIKAEKEVKYIVGLNKSIINNLTEKKVNKSKLSTKVPSKVIVSGYSNIASLKDNDAYQISENEGFEYILDVYNFNESGVSSGKLNILLPKGWEINGKTTISKIELKPLDRKQYKFIVTPHNLGANTEKIRVVGDFDNKKITSCITAYKANMNSVGIVGEKILNWKDLGKIATVDGSQLVIKPLEEEGLSFLFDATYPDGVDKWSYPYIDVAGKDLVGYDGFAVDVEFITNSPNTFVRALFSVEDGGTFMGTSYKQENKGTFIYLFSDVDRGATDKFRYSKLDVSKINRISFGINADSNHVKLKFKNPRLIKIRK